MADEFNKEDIKEEMLTGCDAVEAFKQMPPKHPVLPSQYRWTLEPRNYPGLVPWFNSVKCDISKKTLTVLLYETQKAESHRWLESLQNDNNEFLILTTYDSNGCLLYSLIFCDLILKEHNCNFNYASSDVVQHEAVINYGHCDKKIYRE